MLEGVEYANAAVTGRLIDAMRLHSYVYVNTLLLMFSTVFIFRVMNMCPCFPARGGPVRFGLHAHFISRLGCQSMYLSSAYADNMRDVTGISCLLHWLL